MAFIHQQEVIAAKAINGDGLFVFAVAQLIDINYLHVVIGEEQIAGQAAGAKFLCCNSGYLQLFQVLSSQAFVGCQQDNVVNTLGFAEAPQIPAEQFDIGVHQQGFTRTRGAPEGDTAQLRPQVIFVIEQFKRLMPVTQIINPVLVPAGNLLIDPCQQIAGAGEEVIQIDFSEEQCQILKVLPFQLILFIGLSGRVDFIRQGFDMAVVIQ